MGVKNVWIWDNKNDGRGNGRGGGGSRMKEAGMFVVSLRGINFGFWSHLGCYWENIIIFSREGLV